MGVKALPCKVKALPGPPASLPPSDWPAAGKNLLGVRSQVSTSASVHVSTTPAAAASGPTQAQCSSSVSRDPEERLSLAEATVSCSS